MAELRSAGRGLRATAAAAICRVQSTAARRSSPPVCVGIDASELWPARPAAVAATMTAVLSGHGRQPPAAGAAAAAAVPLLPLLLALLAASAVACPLRSCECKWRDGKETALCANASLHGVPGTLDAGTQVLQLGGNPLRVLTADVFSERGLVNLQRTAPLQLPHRPHRPARLLRPHQPGETRPEPQRAAPGALRHAATRARAARAADQ